MKHKLVKIGIGSYVGIVILALTMTVTNSFAASNDDVVAAIKAFEKKFTDYADKITKVGSTYSNSLKTQMKLNQTSVLASPEVRTKSNAAVDSLLASSVLYAPSATAAAKYYAGLMPDSEKGAQQKANFFNASNYLNTYVLNTSSQNTKDFINTIGGAGSPIQALPATAYNSLSRNPSAVSFLAGMASFSARESVGISALNQLIYERTQIKGYDINGKPASALAYDQEIASQRMNAKFTTFLTDPNTTPAELQRENLLIAAEALHEQFEIRMQLEQLNATLATLLLSYEEGTNKPLLLGARNEAIATALQK